MADPRTRAVDIPGLSGPQIAEPTPSPLQAPQVVPADAGMEGLTQGLNAFFGGGAQGLDAVTKAVQFNQTQEIRGNFYLQRAQAEMQNKQKQEQGSADAIEGQPMNPAMAADYNYQTAFTKTHATLQGQQMGRDWFSQVYANAKPGDDLLGQTNQFVKDQWGSGTGNPLADATTLATFKQFTDRFFLQHQENSVLAVHAQGAQQLQATIAAQTTGNSLTPDFLTNARQQAEALDPMNPSKAPLMVAHSVMAGFDGSPKSAQMISAALSQPGGGVNGKSFQDSFPAQAQVVQEYLLHGYTQGKSFEGAQAYQGLEDQLRNAKTPDDILGVTKGLSDAFNQYGGAAKYDQLTGMAATAITKIAKVATSINAIGQMAGGALPVDPKTVNEHIGDYFTATGLDPYQQPAKAAVVLSQLNMVPDALKANYSRMMMDTQNPQGQMQAFTFYRAFADRYGGDTSTAMKHLDDPTGKAIFNAIDQMRQVQGDNALPQVIAQVDRNVDEARKSDRDTWDQILGSNHQDTVSAVQGAMNGATNALKGTFASRTPAGYLGFGTPGPLESQNVYVDKTTEDAISSMARTQTLVSGGQPDVNAAFSTVMQGLYKEGHLEFLPGANGQTTIRLSPFAQRDTSGKALFPLSANAVDPDTGRSENTLTTFRNDVASLSKTLPGIIDDPSTISVSRLTPVGEEKTAKQQGIYFVQRDGMPIQFAPGQSLTIPAPRAPDDTPPRPTTSGADILPGVATDPLPVTSKVTLDTDPDKAAAQLSAYLPASQGWRLVEDHSSGMFWLGYQPHLAGPAPKDINARQQAVTPTIQGQRDRTQEYINDAKAALVNNPQ